MNNDWEALGQPDPVPPMPEPSEIPGDLLEEILEFQAWRREFFAATQHQTRNLLRPNRAALDDLAEREAAFLAVLDEPVLYESWERQVIGMPDLYARVCALDGGMKAALRSRDFAAVERILRAARGVRRAR